MHSSGNFLKYSKIQIGAQYLYEIKKQLFKKKVRCIFIESQLNSKIIEFITHGKNIKKENIDLFGEKIPLVKNSYIKFLLKLSDQYISCLKNV